MSYYLLPKNYNFLNVNPQHETNECKIYSSYSLYNFYNTIKTEIDILCSKENDIKINDYNELIKIVHPYEYIFFKVPGSKFSVSKLKPQSNMFYDLYEIVVTLNIFELYNNKAMKTLHVSTWFEDSNECVKMLRENYDEDEFLNFVDNDDEMYKSINNMKFDFMFFNKPQNDINLYMINLIEFFMTILRYQSVGGTSIIKIDYIFHKPIVDLIYLLSALFEKVYIIKPNTSNITTFEKYIVCKNFNVINETKLEIYKSNYYKLQSFIKNLDNKNIVSIIDYEIPCYFVNKIDDINIIIGQQQLESLDQIMNILKNKNKDEKIETMKKSNIQKSVSWCEKFKIPYNKFSEKTNIFLPIIKEDKVNNEKHDEEYNVVDEDIKNDDDVVKDILIIEAIEDSLKYI
jgi:hypothetical protein